jgi:hypothetical protein
MHKDFRNSNKIRPVIFEIFDKNYKSNSSQLPRNFDEKFYYLNSLLIENSINKKVKSIGKIVPLSEDNIKKKLLIFIKKNRVAMRTEQSCCRLIKQFDVAAFLYCDTCSQLHNSLSWEICKSCGYFNKFKI